MSRKHASLDKDAELDRAAWIATRGALVGAAKVSLQNYCIIRRLNRAKLTRSFLYPVGTRVCRISSDRISILAGI